MHLGFSPSLIHVEVMTRALLDQKPGARGEWRGRGRWNRRGGAVEGGGGGEWRRWWRGGGGGAVQREVEVEVALPSSADFTDHLSTFCSN